MNLYNPYNKPIYVIITAFVDKEFEAQRGYISFLRLES